MESDGLHTDTNIRGDIKSPRFFLAGSESPGRYGHEFTYVFYQKSCFLFSPYSFVSKTCPDCPDYAIWLNNFLI